PFPQILEHPGITIHSAHVIGRKVVYLRYTPDVPAIIKRLGTNQTPTILLNHKGTLAVGVTSIAFTYSLHHPYITLFKPYIFRLNELFSQDLLRGRLVGCAEHVIRDNQLLFSY